MIDKNSVLQIVKLKGPVIPRDVIKELGGDTFLIGAILSQLTDNKEIKISYVKMGGSPFYYCAGQETKFSILYNYLNEKEKRAHDILKQKKIIRDSDADPLLKVVLRQIKDFAKPLEVNINGQKEIFWKWYFLPNQEAEPIIRDIVSLSQPKKEITQEPIKEQSFRPKYEEKTNKDESQVEKKEYVEAHKEKQEQLIEKQLEKRQENEKTEDKLLNKLLKKFNEKNIEILEKEILRKNSDIELIIKIPSEVGKLKYFCKAKDKKKTNDKDLSSCFVDAQMRKLPMLYVTTGELTKKAQEKQEKEFTTITIMYL